MIAVRLENQKGLNFWMSPNPDDCLMASSPIAWDLHEAKKWVDEHRTEKNPFAVYHIRGFYHKKIWPQ